MIFLGYYRFRFSHYDPPRDRKRERKILILYSILIRDPSGTHGFSCSLVVGIRMEKQVREDAQKTIARVWWLESDRWVRMRNSGNLSGTGLVIM